MSVRQATHANSWYTGHGKELASELSAWLGAVEPTQQGQYSPPIKGCKAIIAPHAGYSYSGATAAWAYKSIDTSGIKRVFILGPSHHVYIDGCALSQCREYQTPIGNLPLDHETITELRSTGKFNDMTLRTDEDEHSIEMHLPFVRKVFEGLDIAIVPILVGAIDYAKEAAYGRLLAPYLTKEDTFCVVSSDFCHWGKRFSYTFYYQTHPPTETGIRLTSSTPRRTYSAHPIHESIFDLDHEGMTTLALPNSTAAETHKKFTDYLTRTKNTICGRHPIGVLLGAITAVEETEPRSTTSRISWVRYEQSSKCNSLEDSSVSYASAYVVF